MVNNRKILLFLQRKINIIISVIVLSKVKHFFYSEIKLNKIYFCLCNGLSSVSFFERTMIFPNLS